MAGGIYFGCLFAQWGTSIVEVRKINAVIWSQEKMRGEIMFWRLHTLKYKTFGGNEIHFIDIRF